MHTKEQDMLRASGLSVQEAKVWFVLAQSGALNVSALAESAQMNRPAVYKTLESLQGKELVIGELRGKRMHYKTTGKKSFQIWQKNIKQNLKNKIKNLPEGNAVLANPNMKVLSGKEIESIWEEVRQMKRGSLVYRYDGYKRPRQAEMYVPDGWYADIDKKAIERFVITNQSLRDSAFKKRIECDSKVLPKKFDAFEQGAIMWIYGNKIAHIDLNKKTAYIIENETIATYQKRLFEYLYRQGIQ